MEDSIEKRKILFVDDEKQILKSLRRVFFKSDYNCFYADSGEKALKILNEYNINLIISDVRMPEMDGFELLKKVKDDYPEVIRLILSGYSKKEDVVDALGKNLMRTYLQKPWNNSELLNIIRKVFEFEDIIADEKLLEYFNNLESLPTVPEIYIKINKMIDENESAEHISKEIEKDQSLSVTILKIANSAFYDNNIGSVKQAIMYVGLTNLKNIILSNSVFNSTNLDNMKDLWKHALLTNKIAGFIYKKILLKKIPELYSSAGLLHDIGRVVIMDYFENENRNMNILLNNNPVDLKIRIQYENEMIGFDHVKIGGYLLNWWGIPYPIIETAMFHHDPLNDVVINKEIVSVIHLANILSWRILKPDMIKDDIDIRVFNYLEIPEDKFYKKIDEFMELESNNI